MKSLVKNNIRSSRHFFKKDINTQKEKTLKSFIEEYNRVLQIMIDYIWENGVSWTVVDNKTGEKTTKICCPKHGYYDTASYFDYKLIKVDTTLSARALSSITSQAMGIISSSIKKHNKRLYQLEQLKKDSNTNSDNIIRLENKIQKNLPQKPEINKKANNVAIELSSKCATLIKTKDGEFNYFLRLQSIGKKYGKIYIPIRMHKHSNQMKTKGKLLGSFLINNDYLDFRWKIDFPEKKKTGKIVGGDTGKNTLLTLSNEKTTDQTKDKHSHTLTSIIETLSRKKKGSKGFEKAQKHRTNFINWSIKRLNLDDIKEIRLEKVKNIFYKNSYSRKMSHWTNTEIEKAIEKACNENGVHLSYQESFYASQRCFSCGLVRKANRKGKLYKCNGCGYQADADLNSARNHTLELPKVPLALRRLKLNRKGFYWKLDGLFNLDGSELKVPNTIKDLSMS